jgi:hypothetical protein
LQLVSLPMAFCCGTRFTTYALHSCVWSMYRR